MLCEETLVVLQFTHNTPLGYFNAVNLSGVHLSCGELILTRKFGPKSCTAILLFILNQNFCRRDNTLSDIIQTHNIVLMPD